MGYAVARRACLSSAAFASVARSMKPGFDGARASNALRSSPGGSAGATNVSCPFSNAALSERPPAPPERTDHNRSSSLGSLTWPSASASGGRARDTMVNALTIVCRSRRIDAPSFVPLDTDAHQTARADARIATNPDLAEIDPHTDQAKAFDPIQTHRRPQRNAMPGADCSIPLKSHDCRATPAMVKTALTGGRS